MFNLDREMWQLKGSVIDLKMCPGLVELTSNSEEMENLKTMKNW